MKIFLHFSHENSPVKNALEQVLASSVVASASTADVVITDSGGIAGDYLVNGQTVVLFDTHKPAGPDIEPGLNDESRFWSVNFPRGGLSALVAVLAKIQERQGC